MKMKLKLISSKELISNVKEAVKLKKKSFHFLMPKCVFNQKKKFAIVFENEKENETCVCYFDKQHRKELKICENLFYKHQGLNKY